MIGENPRIRRISTRRAGWRAGLAAVLLLTLGTAPVWAQTSPATPAAAPPSAAGDRKDASIAGNARSDTQVLHPKDGDTLTIRLPLRGHLIISSLIPWAVTGGKETAELVVAYDVRGIDIIHTGGTESNGAKVSFNLRLVDGRKITVNVRTGNTKYKIGFAVIT